MIAAFVPERAAPAQTQAGVPMRTQAAARVAAPNEIFTPTRPRAGRRALVGRADELARILQALNEEAAHVVLYAERGRGKTSLANLAVERLRRAGFIVGRHACDAASDFDSIIRGLMRSLPHALLAHDEVTDNADAEGCESVLPKRALTPADIAAIPGQLACPKLVFVVDEFDRVEDRATRTRLADTIKLLSDRGEKLLFMIVGVSTTLEQIIGQHPSIERNIAALHLALLTEAEIYEMLQRGGEAAGIRFSDPACATVAGVARGMPYMAQLMGLRIAQLCVARGTTATTELEVRAAVERMVSDAASEVASRYAVLTAGPRGADMAYVLHAVAAAPQDRWGRISPDADVGFGKADVDNLIQQGVLATAAGAPNLLQPADRRLMYHTLLLAARDGAPSGRSATPNPLGATRSSTHGAETVGA